MNPISSIRARLGVTQAAMAEGIGVSQGNVSNYEHGQTMPPDVSKRLICFAADHGVQITFNDIYGEPHVEEVSRPAPTEPFDRPRRLLDYGKNIL